MSCAGGWVCCAGTGGGGRSPMGTSPASPVAASISRSASSASTAKNGSRLSEARCAAVPVEQGAWKTQGLWAHARGVEGKWDGALTIEDNGSPRRNLAHMDVFNQRCVHRRCVRVSCVRVGTVLLRRAYDSLGAELGEQGTDCSAQRRCVLRPQEICANAAGDDLREVSRATELRSCSQDRLQRRGRSDR